MKKILVVGSLNMDLVTNVEKSPKVGETILGTDIVEYPGGKGANQAVALGRLGGLVSMVGMVGNDTYGDQLLKNLDENGVEAKGIIRTSSVSTGLAMIMVNEDGNNSIVVIPGANGKMTKAMMTQALFEGVDYLLVQLEVPITVVEAALKMAKEKNVTTILNPAPMVLESGRILKYVDMIIPNEVEFESLTSLPPTDDISIEKGCQKLFQLGIREVVVTLGGRGAVYRSKSGDHYRSLGYDVKVLDTTAAGDSFIGGLLASYAQGYTIEESMEYAMKVGALTVTKEGAQSSLPWKVDLEAYVGQKVTLK